MTHNTQIILQTIMDAWMAFTFCFLVVFVKHHITIDKENK